MRSLIKHTTDAPTAFGISGSIWRRPEQFQEVARFIRENSGCPADLKRLAARFRRSQEANPKGLLETDLQCMLEEVVREFEPTVKNFGDWFDSFYPAAFYHGLRPERFSFSYQKGDDYRHQTVKSFLRGPNLRILITRIRLLLRNLPAIDSNVLEGLLANAPTFDARFFESVFDRFNPADRSFESHFEIEVCSWLLRQQKKIT